MKRSWLILADNRYGENENEVMGVIDYQPITNTPKTHPKKKYT